LAPNQVSAKGYRTEWIGIQIHNTDFSHRNGENQPVGLLCFHELQSLLQRKLLPSEFIQLSLQKKHQSIMLSQKQNSQSISAYKNKTIHQAQPKNITINHAHLSLQKTVQSITLGLQKPHRYDQPKQKQNNPSAQPTKAINHALPTKK
jgi:hypothetical protein